MTASSKPIATYVVGVTGGIGSGKTTVCNLFAEHFGVPVIDADLVAREVVEPGQAALTELVELFGDDILDASGQLDRRKLKAIVFADNAKRLALEAVLHPRIRQRIDEHLREVRTPYCLLCVPLLAEGGRSETYDRILVVDCPESLQIARVTGRDDLTQSQVMAIMRTQATREARLAIADDTIVNDGDNRILAEQVRELHERYLDLAGKAKTAVART